jgi:hypothetical protein
VAGRTLEELSIFLRRDMLSRRELLNTTVLATTGAVFAQPFLRWAQIPAVPLPDHGRRPGQIGMEEVTRIEAAKYQFSAQDSAIGGGLSRKAAAGQLLDAVDLLHEGRFTSAVRDRLLVAISSLAAMVGWMSHDTGLEGVAQRYFVLAAQAVRESRDERARVVYIAPLLNLARQQLVFGHPDTGVDLVDHALTSLGRGDSHPEPRALLWNLRGRLLAAKGPSCRREMESAFGMAFDLTPECGQDPDLTYANPAEFHGLAGESYLDLAMQKPQFLRQAEDHLESAVKLRAPEMTRSLVFDRMTLARVHLAAHEPEQAVVEGGAAMMVAGGVTGSRRVARRLRKLDTEAARYGEVPAVRAFRARLAART